MPHAATLIRALFGQTVSSFTTLNQSGAFNEAEFAALVTAGAFTAASFFTLTMSGTLQAQVVPVDDLTYDTRLLLRSGLRRVRKNEEWFGDRHW